MKLPKEVEEHIGLGGIVLSKKPSELYDYKSVSLKCESLPEPVWKKSAKIPPDLNESFFKRLPDKSCPALYYFEIIGSTPTGSSILEAYREMKNDPDIERASAALKKKPPTGTSILYVGKVKKNLPGRMKVHLGYYHNGNTSGLQLYCWARSIKLELKVHLFTFTTEMAPFISILELPFSHSLNPMIGKQ